MCEEWKRERERESSSWHVKIIISIQETTVSFNPISLDSRALPSLPPPFIWNDLKNCMFQFQCGATLDTYPLTHPRSSPKGLANFCYDDGSSRENLPWLDVLTVLRCPGCSTCRYKLLESNWIDLNPSFFNIFKKFDKHI